MCFCLAPKSISPGVVALNIVSAPTKLPTSQTGAHTTHPTHTVTEATVAAGLKPESLSPEPQGGVNVSDVTQTSSKRSKVNKLKSLGGTKENQIDGLVPGTHNNTTLNGLLEEKESQPVSGHAKTGTWIKLLPSPIILTIHGHSFSLIIHLIIHQNCKSLEILNSA